MTWGRPDYDLSDLSRWQLCVTAIYHLDLCVAERLAARAHPRATGRIVIFRRQQGDNAPVVSVKPYRCPN
jgi:hypothetical protein